MLYRNTLTTEFVMTDVGAVVQGAPVNPTADVVQFAFKPAGITPGPGDWVGGSWETDMTVTPNRYEARCLVGPTGVILLTPASYVVWIRVFDTPEEVVRPVDTLVITDALPVISPVDVSIYCGKDFTPEQETFVRQVITFLTDELELYAGRPLTPRSFVDLYTLVEDQNNVFFHNTPVLSIASIVAQPNTPSATTLDPLTYITYPWGVVLADPTYSIVFAPNTEYFPTLEGSTIQASYAAGKDGASTPGVRSTVTRAAAREFLAREADVQNVKSFRAGSMNQWTFTDQNMGGFTVDELKRLSRLKRRRLW